VKGGRKGKREKREGEVKGGRKGEEMEGTTLTETKRQRPDQHHPWSQEQKTKRRYHASVHLVHFC
jgi:hypothetical protein